MKNLKLVVTAANDFWESLSYTEQQNYLKTHPKSKKKITKKPPSKAGKGSKLPRGSLGINSPQFKQLYKYDEKRKAAAVKKKAAGVKKKKANPSVKFPTPDKISPDMAKKWEKNYLENTRLLSFVDYVKDYLRKLDDKIDYLEASDSDSEDHFAAPYSEEVEKLKDTFDEVNGIAAYLNKHLAKHKNLVADFHNSKRGSIPNKDNTGKKYAGFSKKSMNNSTALNRLFDEVFPKNEKDPQYFGSFNEKFFKKAANILSKTYPGVDTPFEE